MPSAWRVSFSYSFSAFSFTLRRDGCTLEDGSYLRGTRSTLHRRDPVVDPHPRRFDLVSPFATLTRCPRLIALALALIGHAAATGQGRVASTPTPHPRSPDEGWRNLRLRHGVHLRAPFQQRRVNTVPSRSVFPNSYPISLLAFQFLPSSPSSSSDLPCPPRRNDGLSSDEQGLDGEETLWAE